MKAYVCLGAVYNLATSKPMQDERSCLTFWWIRDLLMKRGNMIYLWKQNKVNIITFFVSNIGCKNVSMLGLTNGCVGLAICCSHVVLVFVLPSLSVVTSIHRFTPNPNVCSCFQLAFRCLGSLPNLCALSGMQVMSHI